MSEINIKIDNKFNNDKEEVKNEIKNVCCNNDCVNKKEEEKNKNKKIENEFINKKHLKKLEKENEEINERIFQLKEKLIESKKDSYCINMRISEREVFTVIDKVYPLIEKEESMLELESPIYICGDIHGQFYDLLRLFEILKYPPQSKYLFLGDYVDRGKNSLECILLLLCLKIEFPEKIFLLRGNHESADVNRTFGFYDECKRKVSLKIYKKFCSLFNILPITALISEKILCMHGGLSKDLTSINQLKLIKRPTEIPEKGLLCDLVWSDPDNLISNKNFIENKERGISFCFSKEIVEEFTKINNLDLICRAHQVVEEGFQFFANMKLITIFTAPNYMNVFDNNGGVLYVNEDLICSLHVLNPSHCGEKNRKKITNRFID
jgi:serine/threonine-protein phosphatase PP1 catalytic subunit